MFALGLLMSLGIALSDQSQARRAEDTAKLEEVLSALQARESASTGPASNVLDLAGYAFYWQVSTVQSTLLIISRNLQGDLLLFDRAGLLKDRRKIREVTSLLLCDLDSDKVPEVVTEETHGRGTGVLARSIHLYSLKEGGITELWSTEGFSYWQTSVTSPIATFDSSVAYVNCQTSGLPDHSPHLFYVLEKHPADGPSSISRTALQLKEGVIREVPWPWK